MASCVFWRFFGEAASTRLRSGFAAFLACRPPLSPRPLAPPLAFPSLHSFLGPKLGRVEPGGRYKSPAAAARRSLRPTTRNSPSQSPHPSLNVSLVPFSFSFLFFRLFPGDSSSLCQVLSPDCLFSRVGCSRCNTLHSFPRRHGDSAVLPAHVGRLPAGDRAAQPGPHQRPPQARRGQDQEEEAAEEAEGEWRPEMFSFLLSQEIDSWSSVLIWRFGNVCLESTNALLFSFSAAQKVFFVKSLFWDFENTALASLSSLFPSN